jgi:hypothetical protein
MKTKKNRLILLLGLIALMATAFFPRQILAESPMADNIQATNGIASMADISVLASQATSIGTLPTGQHGFIALASGDINIGTSSVTTGTAEIYIPNGEHRWFGYFYTPNPSVYFRVRGGTAVTTSTLILRPGPQILNPNGD